MILFQYFSPKTDFDISCALSPIETIGMKCQIVFSRKNKKNIINLWSTELAQREVNVDLRWAGARRIYLRLFL